MQTQVSHDFVRRTLADEYSHVEPVLMGILNITPDSFSDGGRWLEKDAALAHAIGLYNDGALIIDVGGESTRPGSQTVDPTTEFERLNAIVLRLREELPEDVTLSIDTRRARIAAFCLQQGFTIVNDVSGGQDPAMFELIADKPKCKIVINHHRGIPVSLQDHPSNPNILKEVMNYFDERIRQATQQGVKLAQMILDPGFGFGKTNIENVLLLIGLTKLKENYGLPLLIGLSRKRIIRSLNASPNVESFDEAGAILAISSGADIIRCHDPAIHRKVMNAMQIPR